MTRPDQRLASAGCTTWSSLYRAGGAAALIAAVFLRRNLDAEWLLLRSIGVFKAGPGAAPSAMAEWFALLQQHPLIGLTLLNLFDLVNYALVGLILLALCAALRRVNGSWVAIAAALGAAGVTSYFASNQALTLLSLSRQYAAAASEAQRAVFLAAGHATLAIHQNNSYAGGRIYISLLSVTVAGLIVSVVMLRSTLFSKACAWTGILANGFGLGYYLLLPFAPGLVAIPISISAVFLLAWYLLAGVRLWVLGRK